MATREYLNRVRKTCVADGRLLEAGFLLFRLDYGLEGAAAEQLIALRRAFMRGARQAHALMGTEPPEAMDGMVRAVKLRAELCAFLIEEMREKAGNAAQEAIAAPDVTGPA